MNFMKTRNSGLIEEALSREGKYREWEKRQEYQKRKIEESNEKSDERIESKSEKEEKRKKIIEKSETRE